MRLRGAFVVRFALAVVLVLAVFGSIGIIRPTSPADAMPGEKPFLDAGKTMALALTTVGYRTVDRDVQSILDNATAPFYDDFKARSADFTKVVRDARSTSISVLDEARLESFDNGRARVFVGLTTTTTNEGQPPQPPRKWRLVITVQKVGDGYKASQVQFLQ